MSDRLQHALEALYGLERRRDKLGLDGTRALLAALGNPERRFRSVHVAGTNGKGSTCALIERALREAGHRTGLFTSPHLVDFRERIRVDGRWADEAALAVTLDRIERLPEGRDRTFFEVATALGFDWFAAQGVEWAVVEVGLGGRLDTTNVLAPDLCVITPIGLDHTEILGDTLAAIAAEKAGILKPGVPVVLADSIIPEAREAIERIARERGVPVIAAPVDSSRLAPPASALPAVALLGAHQSANARTALAAVEALVSLGVSVPPDAIRAGFERARWPGRLEACPHEPRLWWDGAHNLEGLRALIAAWPLVAQAPPRALVLSLSRDKDAARIVGAIAEAWPGVRVVATRSRNERAMDAGELDRIATSAELTSEAAPDIPAAVRRALALAGTGRVLLAGSLFAVGEAMEAFGGAPGEWQ